MRGARLMPNTAYTNVCTITDLSNDFSFGSVADSQYSELELITPTVGNPYPGKSLNLPLTPYPNGLLSPSFEFPEMESPEPDTPSPVDAEFGDRTNGAKSPPLQVVTLSSPAAQLVERVHRSYSQSRVGRSESCSRDSEEREGRRRGSIRSQSVGVVAAGGDPRSRSMHSSPRNGRGLTTARERKTMAPERSPSVASTQRDLSKARVSRFLYQMAPQASMYSEKELLMENRSLQKQLAELERRQERLLADNQDLFRQIELLKQDHEVHRQQWEDDFQVQEQTFAIQLQDAKDQVPACTDTEEPRAGSGVHSLQPAPSHLQDLELLQF